MSGQPTVDAEPSCGVCGKPLVSEILPRPGGASVVAFYCENPKCWEKKSEVRD